MSEFMKELNRWQITPTVENYRVVLSGGDKRARKHYSDMLENNLDFEIKLILELSENDFDLRYDIEERAAIGGYDDLEIAVKQLMRRYRNDKQIY